MSNYDYEASVIEVLVEDLTEEDSAMLMAIAQTCVIACDRRGEPVAYFIHLVEEQDPEPAHWERNHMQSKYGA